MILIITSIPVDNDNNDSDYNDQDNYQTIIDIDIIQLE